MNARIFASIVAATLLLGAAPAPAPAPATAPAITGFKHDPKIDVFGYYIPQPALIVGKWEVTSLNIGVPQDFIDFEKGKRDHPEFAPINFEFAESASPMVQNELGGEAHSRTIRLLPTAYSIAGNRIVFIGKDAAIGTVIFTGTLDVPAIKRAAGGDTLTSTGVVLTGDLTVGTHVLKNLKFTWFGGD